ncbi:M56 family metallopeptidase [Paludisphaera rhizosphaerae]|uniref:M56 family metallopeptidase n=1 Tax=Paludisphaera rhizosphaerae TaxID=2711216 RepID=UPI0013EE0999|nr:M56 family metallopeptidase [Paludisphaera rhizosphaerae]
MEELMRSALTNALAASALAAVAAGLALILSRRPAIVHCIWVVVLLKLVTPPMFEFSVARFLPEPEPTPELVTIAVEDLEGIDWEAFEACEPVEVVEEAAVQPAWEIDPTLIWKGLGIVWLAGSLATAVLAGTRIVRFQRRLRDASPAGWAVEEEVEILAAEMGLRQVPLVDIVDARTTPMLWGLGVRPRLILPRMLWKELDGRSRTLLLTHELAHLKRGDHLLRFLELAVTVLYWWLPVVWLARRALRDVEEQCCDAWVVWMFPDDARAYAETLLDTVDFLNPGAEPEPLLASGFGKVHHLRKRLTMVMKGTTPRALGWKGSLTALALSGVLLPMSPTWAQKAAESTDTATATATVSASADGVGETTTVIVSETQDGSPDVLTLRAIARDGVPATVEVAGKDDSLAANTITVRAVADVADVKTIDVKGPNIAFAGAPITVKIDDEKDKKDKVEKDGDKKDETKVQRQFRYEFRGVPAEAREGMKKAVEELKARIKELEDKKSDGPEAEIQIKALKAALEQVEKMSNTPLGRIAVAGQPSAPGDVKVFRRELKVDDPKAQEARKQVDELRKVLAEKQKEMSEAATKLAKAQAELAKISHEFVAVRPDVNLQLKEVRALTAPRIAEGRALLVPGSDAKDKARIEALEKKLDQVLKQLDSLKKPESDDKK